MGIGLVADVKDKFVFRSVENIVPSHDQFHGAETGTEMTWIGSAAFHHILPDF